MAQKLAVGGGLIFCFIVALLMIILYYPRDAFEQELDAFSETKLLPNSTAANEFKKTPEDFIEDSDSRSTFADVAKVIENFGAAFLALGAVICVAVGMACIFCACCIV